MSLSFASQGASRSPGGSKIPLYLSASRQAYLRLHPHSHGRSRLQQWEEFHFWIHHSSHEMRIQCGLPVLPALREEAFFARKAACQASGFSTLHALSPRGPARKRSDTAHRIHENSCRHARRRLARHVGWWLEGWRGWGGMLRMTWIDYE